MAVTAKLYANYIKNSCNGGINLTGDTIKCALCTASYTPNQGTHDYFDDITNEVVGTGYTAGGATLGSKTVTTNGNTTTFDAANPSWTSSTITARFAIIYKSTGTAGTSPLIGYIDFGQDYISTNGTFTVNFDAAGIFQITVS